MVFETFIDIFRERKGESCSFSPLHVCVMQAPLSGTKSIINRDGSLTTWLAIDGARRMMGGETFAEFEDVMNSKLSGLLDRSGMTISLSYNKDNDMTRKRLSEAFGAAIKKEGEGFRVGEIIRQQESVLSTRVTHEQAYMSITTHPEVQHANMAKKNLKSAREAFREASLKFMKGLQADYSQIPKTYIKEIVNRHESFYRNIKSTLEMFLDVRVLDPEEVISEMRGYYYPECATPNFKARLAGSSSTDNVGDSSQYVSSRKKKHHISTEKRGSNNDISNLLHASIAEQVILSDSEIDDSEAIRSGVHGVVRIGKRYYAPVLISSPPESHLRFDEFFRSVDFNTPFRLTMNVSTGHEKFIGRLEWIKNAATMLVLTNSDNKRIKESCEVLIEDYKAGNDVALKVHSLFITWGKTPTEADSNRDNLIASIQSWGAADATPEYGDPYLSSLESMPGFTYKRTAPGFIQSLSETIRVMPYTRPASPWRNGSMQFYTKENKLWGYSPGSSLQGTWVELVSAGPGSGKSIYMAASNLAMMMASPGKSLPRIGIMDVGSSSQYMVNMARAILPPDMQDEVAAYRLTMDPKAFAANPFDTFLGCRYPLSADRAFLINFLSLVLRPVDSNVSEVGSTEFITLIVDEIYRSSDPDVNIEGCKRYTRNQIPELEKVIEERGLVYESSSTPLFDIVDELIDMGEINVANKVQRFAVPNLTDIPATLNMSRIISDQYSDDAGKLMMNSIRKQIGFAVTAYPIIAKPTVFDVGNASIVSFDLEEVVKGAKIGAEGARKAQICYMLVRYLLGKNFYRNLDMVEEDAIPKKYKSYHRNWIRKEQARIKRLCADEFHYTNGDESILSQIKSDARTGRKNQLILTLVSQDDEDFDHELRGMATTTIIMGGSASNEVKKAQIEKYGLDKDTGRALKNDLAPPNHNGSSMIITGQTKAGQFCQMVYFMAPPIMVWGLSTTTEDVTLRNCVVEHEGSYMVAVNKLSRVFRQGSAKFMFERMRADPSIDFGGAENVDLEIARMIYEKDIKNVELG